MSALLKHKSRDAVSTTDDRRAVNEAMRAGGIKYAVAEGTEFDDYAFTQAALKRWPKVAAKLAE